MKKSIIYIFFFIFSFLNLPSYGETFLDISEDDFVIGDENAPITIIEYASLSCSHCSDFHNNTLGKLKNETKKTPISHSEFRKFRLQKS